jgi:myo-inositol catabolism protein IolC
LEEEIIPTLNEEYTNLMDAWTEQAKKVESAND